MIKIFITAFGIFASFYTFAQMPESHVKTIENNPELFINGEKTLPVMTFVNAGIAASSEVNKRQIKYAAEYADIHLHQINFALPMNADGSFNYLHMKNALNLMLDADPVGMAVVRLHVMDHYTSHGGYTDEDRIKFSDGSMSDIISFASDKWIENAEKKIRACIEYSGQNPEYEKAIVGYFPEASEWFQPEHREYGVDASEVNTKKFREWLVAKYSTPEKLQLSWNMPAVTFETAEIPADQIGKSQAMNGYYTKMFDDPSDKRVLDYLEYYNELTAQRIIKLAGVIKEASDNKLLSGFFYGYLFDLWESKSGHYDLGKILDCPDIDFLAGPVSYRARNEGEIGSSMSVTESVQSHGKIWFDECDYRSPKKTAEGVPFADVIPYAKSMDGLREIYRRQYGFQMIRGNGCWPMDLMGMGWYDDIDFWKDIKQLNALFSAYEEIRPATNPEVALVVDEKGLMLTEDPDFTVHMLWYLRDELYKTGVNFGIYLREDIEKGLAPNAKLYIMIGAFRLQPQTVENLTKVLHQEGKTTLWVYGFGITPQSLVEELTNDASNGSRHIVHESNQLKADQIREVAKSAGVHTYISGGFDSSMANENLLVFNASGYGKRAVKFPEKTDVYEQFTNTWYSNVDEITLNVQKGKAYMFFYGEKSKFIDSDIGKITENNTQENEHLIYPNPTKDYISIHTGSEKIENLNLYSLNGTKIKSQKRQSSNYYAMNLDNIPAGTYVLEIVHDKKVFRHKVIKN